MWRLSSLIFLAVLTILAGCAESPAPEPEIPSDGSIGYLREERNVIFRFDPSEFEKVTRNDNGRWVDISNVDIRTVAVAGDFNGWSKEAWRMSEIGNGIYELRKNISFFEARSEWEFKFVLNSFYWVEPPEEASNSTASGVYKLNRSYNLILRSQ